MEPPPMDTVSNEEYQLAVAFITDEYQTLSAVLPDPAQLDRLIALQTLIEKGPCNVKPPSFTDAQARKKWRQWKELGTLPAEQAAVKYVEIAQSVAYEASSKESAKEFLVELKALQKHTALFKSMETPRKPPTQTIDQISRQSTIPTPPPMPHGATTEEEYMRQEVRALISNLTKEVARLKTALWDDSSQLTIVEQTINHNVAQLTNIEVSAQKTLDDFADSELGAEWKAFKAEAAEIESSINALRQSTSSSDMKRAVTKKRLDAMLDELEERCESLENSLQMEERESRSTWSFFGYMDYLLVPATILIGVYNVYKLRKRIMRPL